MRRSRAFRDLRDRLYSFISVGQQNQVDGFGYWLAHAVLSNYGPIRCY